MKYQEDDTVELRKDYYPTQGGKIPKGAQGKVLKADKYLGKYLVDFGEGEPVILSDDDLV